MKIAPPLRYEERDESKKKRAVMGVGHHRHYQGVGCLFYRLTIANNIAIAVDFILAADGLTKAGLAIRIRIEGHRDFDTRLLVILAAVLLVLAADEIKHFRMSLSLVCSVPFRQFI